MDDKTFNRFIGLVTKHQNKDNVNVKEMLQFIRNNPYEIKNCVISEPAFYTRNRPCTVYGNGQLGCFIYTIVFSVYYPLIFSYVF